MAIVVTGATGQLGRGVVESLLARGVDPAVAAKVARIVYTSAPAADDTTLVLAPSTPRPRRSSGPAGCSAARSYAAR